MSAGADGRCIGASNRERLGVTPTLFSWTVWLCAGLSPFWPWTIVPYWIIDLLYGLSLFVCASKGELDTHAKRLLTAQLVAVFCFIAFPFSFTFERPAVDPAEDQTRVAERAVGHADGTAPESAVDDLVPDEDLQRVGRESRWTWVSTGSVGFSRASAPTSLARCPRNSKAFPSCASTIAS